MSIFSVSAFAAGGEEKGAIGRRSVGSFSRQAVENSEEPGKEFITAALTVVPKEEERTTDSRTFESAPHIDTMYGAFDLRCLFDTFDDWSSHNQQIQMKNLKEVLENEGITAEDFPKIKEKQDEYRRARSFEKGELFVEKEQEYIDLVNDILPYWRLEHPPKPKDPSKA